MKETYAYRVLEEGLDELVQALDCPAATRALTKLKLMVLAHAWVEFGIWKPSVDNVQAMAWAWEDMDMAFKGYGDSSLTGAVMNLWTALGPENWAQAKTAINKASMAAGDATPKRVPRQYLLQYRVKTCRTPEMGFDLPHIMPAWGRRLHEWAESQGLEPQETEHQMQLIEEYERMGILRLPKDGDGDVELGVTRPHLQLVPAEEGPASSAEEVVDDSLFF